MTNTSRIAILNVLSRPGVELDRTTIVEITGIVYRTVNKSIQRMIEDRHVSMERKSGYRIGCTFSITDEGRNAIRRHQQSTDSFAGEIVPPKRMNLFALPTLSIQFSGYQRNGGNKHIQSRGLRC